MYAIKNIETGCWLCGSDFDYQPPKIRTSDNYVITFFSYAQAEAEFYRRRLGDARIPDNTYQIVRVKVVEA